MKPRVLFVSKPVRAPFHDGTKCLVRDLAQNLSRFTPCVMGELNDGSSVRIERVPVYPRDGGFTPGRSQNARAALYLLGRADADLWHFVFAPNPASSLVGAFAKRVRRVPVVQTVASPPARFQGAGRWLFGDIVVAQSSWTARQLMAEPGVRRVEVIPPCVGQTVRPADDACLAVRRDLSIPEHAPVFVYPGDLETSSAALTVAQAVPELTRSVPGAVVVFACRKKTAAAPMIQRGLERNLAGLPVRFAGELASILPLVQTSRAVLFPVDDLRGKVDLPIVVLEAMQLGVPVVVAAGGPLDDLESVMRVPPADPQAIVRACVQLESEPNRRAHLTASASQLVDDQYSAGIVAFRYEQVYDRALRLTAEAVRIGSET